MFDRRLLVNFDLFFIISSVYSCPGHYKSLQHLSVFWEESSVFFYRQIYWIALGLVVFCLFCRSITLRSYATPILHSLALLLLLVVIVIGKTKLGSQRWLALGGEHSAIRLPNNFIFMLSKFYSETVPRSPLLARLWLPGSFWARPSAIFAQPDLRNRRIVALHFCFPAVFVRVNIKSFLLCACCRHSDAAPVLGFLKAYQSSACSPLSILSLIRFVLAIKIFNQK